MNTSEAELAAWLSGLNAASDTGQEFWDPGFEAERQVVVSRLGPYRRVFERPPHFIPRFFHRVYPLLIEDWHVSTKIRLYGGFCTMIADLHVHFQATFKYAIRNMEVLPQLNQHIKTSYEGLLSDIVNAELRNLDDGEWIHTGLSAMERQIETVIHESLIVKHIQSRAICALKPVFDELTDHGKLDDRFTKSMIYLNVLQKNFAFRQQQHQELFRQEEELELQRLAHKQKQLENIHRDAEIQQQKQALETSAIKRLLEDKEKQQLESFAIETRLHEEKISHETRLKEIEQATAAQYQKDQQIQQQQLELEMQIRQFEHERLKNEQEWEAGLKEFEQHRQQWLQNKEQEQQLKHQKLEEELKEQELFQL
ncbi:MAG: hypothetical protein ACXWVZ_06470, partial [Kaistella sp.]